MLTESKVKKTLNTCRTEVKSLDAMKKDLGNAVKKQMAKDAE